MSKVSPSVYSTLLGAFVIFMLSNVFGASDSTTMVNKVPSADPPEIFTLAFFFLSISLTLVLSSLNSQFSSIYSSSVYILLFSSFACINICGNSISSSVFDIFFLIWLWFKAKYVRFVNPDIALMSLIWFPAKYKFVRFVNPDIALMSLIWLLYNLKYVRFVNPDIALMSLIWL